MHLPEGIASLEAGDDAITFAESLGLVLDDWQQWLVRMLLAERADGRLAASTAVILVPRQNGKNVVLAAVEMYGLCVAGLRRQVHSAHLTDTAAEHMKFLKELVEDNDLDADSGGYLHVYESNGKERIVNVETRGELSFNTRTKSTKRGTPPQRIVFDEALFLTDDQTQAMAPSLAAQSMSADTSPQIIATSSAPIAESETLARMRRLGLDGARSTLVADWGCAPDWDRYPDTGVDITDRDLWYEANPGLGVRISEDFIEDTELSSGTMTPQAFAIERLGVVFDVEDLASELPGWGRCLDESSAMVGEPKALAVDVAMDSSWTSIAVAGDRADKLAHVEVTDHLVRTDGVVEILAAMHKLYRVPVHLDPRSAAAGLLDGLERAGVAVVQVGGVDILKACAGFKREVESGLLRHRGQGPLDDAVRVAAIKAVEDGWKWTRRSSRSDISSLYAVTLALHAHRSAPGPKWSAMVIGGKA